MREALIIAGEASGDLHAAALAEAWQPLLRDTKLTGVGGARMRAAGVELIEELHGVVGFAEVIRHIPAHARLLGRIKERLRGGSVGLIVLVDYPGFNMRVAAAAKAAGVPVLYYITPQVWAWRRGRLRTMADVITRAAVILPFEEAMLREAGINATFVGHPLLDRARSLPTRGDARRRLGLREDAPVLALFPGSRPQEIARHWDRCAVVADMLQRRRPGLQVVVSAAPTVAPGRFAGFHVVPNASFEVFAAADAALCKSGTTTLESAVAGCPSVIVYRTSTLSYQIARRLVRVDHIGLLNIVAGKRVAPEFVQHEFEPAAVADALDPLLDRTAPARTGMLAELARIRTLLGEPGASARVAAMANSMIR